MKNTAYSIGRNCMDIDTKFRHIHENRHETKYCTYEHNNEE